VSNLQVYSPEDFAALDMSDLRRTVKGWPEFARLRSDSIVLLHATLKALLEEKPQTVRQIFYVLVAVQLIAKTLNRYKAISELMVKARKRGIIPWDWIEDPTRETVGEHRGGGCDSAADFINTQLELFEYGFSLKMWPTQPRYVEIWTESLGMVRRFDDIASDYRLAVTPARGYDGWSSLHDAAERYQEHIAAGRSVRILHFGDFDPSGMDAPRSLRERLLEFGVKVEVKRCFLTVADIKRYKLPTALPKANDPRTKGFVEKYGERTVEIEALPARVFRTRLKSEIEANLDMSAFHEVKRQTREQRAEIKALADELRARYRVKDTEDDEEEDED
jgi:hypothetical protein